MKKLIANFVETKTKNVETKTKTENNNYARKYNNP